ncbi:MAG: FG-GAP-like repeat-containing protein, partial [Deltaproteobacteria bacterium]|nr:FG-GAP-like repeat-containing protein [Deltaproteobacteria bacterium]
IESIPDLSGQQGYLGRYETTGGLSFEAMWEKEVLGNNVRIVHAGECAWNTDHEDLPRSPLIKPGRRERCPDFDIAHGTAMLGILAANNDNHGTRGMANQSEFLTDGDDGGCEGAASIDLFGGTIYLCAAPALGANNTPVAVEVSPAAFAAFEAATAAGVTVVEAAGHHTVNYDTDPVYFEGSHDLSRENSGAIMVGASMGASRQKLAASNCGNRIDLYSWGSGIVTTSYPSVFDWEGTPPFDNNPNNPNTFYTNKFGGTSASSAIIAGAAALLQSYGKQQMGTHKYLTPQKIKDILVQSGVDAVGDNGCRIGRQPRMDAVIDLFDSFWTGIRRDFPELARGDEIGGSRRLALRNRGVGLVCNLWDFETSDPSCPETATCVLETGEQISNLCKNMRCMPLDVARSDYDCVAGAIWPAGLKIAKPLDFDGDGKADLVNWTKAKWQIDLSSKNGLGAWDVQITPPAISTRWLWPVTEDYNSDGRTDLAVYDKEHGVWYIKFMNAKLLGLRTVDQGPWTWDRQVTHPYRDELNRNVWATKYARPLPGDYNSDGWIDLALARSDGIWSIDFGGPLQSDYGTFDQNVTYLTAAELSQAPGWAYLPSSEQVGSLLLHKIPDGLSGEGELWYLYPNDNISGVWNRDGDRFTSLSGNGSIPLFGWYGSSYVAIKSNSGDWDILNSEQSLGLLPSSINGIFGGLDCHPFVADCDGDGVHDRAVQCPTEFRIVMSATNELLRVPLGYNTTEFSLPGKIYTGGISYSTVQQWIQYQLNTSPAAPIIPVDMAQPSFCTLPWASQMPECR